MPPESDVEILDPIEEPTTEQTKDQTQTSSTTETTKPDSQKSDTTDTTGKDKDGKSLLNEEGEKKEEPKGAPEKYEDFKVPEGFTLDAEVAKEAGDLFKSMNLSQDQGQKLVDFYTAKTQEAAAAPYKLWQDTQKAWVDEMKADPELGGKLGEVRSRVASAIDGLGDPKLASAFREAMDITGAGNHPAFIRAFYKLAQKVTEGTAVPGTKPSKFGQTEQSDRPRSIANALYPNLP